MQIRDAMRLLPKKLVTVRRPVTAVVGCGTILETDTQQVLIMAATESALKRFITDNFPLVTYSGKRTNKSIVMRVGSATELRPAKAAP